jgi:MFS family permease
MAVTPPIFARRFRPASLDALNFLLADVHGALGPYLNVYLVTEQHWSQSAVGLMTSTGGLIGLVLRTPVGAAIDATRAKRGIIIAALAMLAIGASVIALLPNLWPVMVANSLIAIAGDVFGPAVAAITLGLVAREQLARRMGRNAAFDHAGNVAIAVLAGAVGWAFSQRAVFFLAPFFSVLAAAAVLTIPAGAIDHRRARGLQPLQVSQGGEPAPSGWTVLISCRPLLLYACCTFLFHFANAPLLPLVGQKFRH